MWIRFGISGTFLCLMSCECPQAHQHRVLVIFILLVYLIFIVSFIVFICSENVTYKPNCIMFVLQCYGSNPFRPVNTFTAIVDLSRSNFSIARTPLFQLKSAM